MREYDEQASAFLQKYRLSLHLQCTASKCPPWKDKKDRRCVIGPTDAESTHYGHGKHYTVSIERVGVKSKRENVLQFDFWGSIADALEGKDPTAYDILSCISSDISASEDADEIAEELGPMKPSTALAVAEFGKKLRAFFTPDEQEALSEIR